jgi:hypothetical protein
MFRFINKKVDSMGEKIRNVNRAGNPQNQSQMLEITELKIKNAFDWIIVDWT